MWLWYLDVPYSNTMIFQLHVFECCVVTWGSKNGHQQRHVFERDQTTCSKFVNFSRFNIQHDWREGGTYLTIPRMDARKMWECSNSGHFILWCQSIMLVCNKRKLPLVAPKKIHSNSIITILFYQRPLHFSTRAPLLPLPLQTLLIDIIVRFRSQELAKYIPMSRVYHNYVIRDKFLLILALKTRDMCHGTISSLVIP